jgi:hypothetical protein
MRLGTFLDISRWIVEVIENVLPFFIGPLNGSVPPTNCFAGGSRTVK